MESYLDFLTKYPNDHPDQPSALHDLANDLSENPDMASLDQAICYRRIAAARVPKDHADRNQILDGLVEDLRSRFERNGSTSAGDIDEAIQLEQGLISTLTPIPSVILLQRKCNLATLSMMRFQVTKSSNDLDACLEILKPVHRDAESHDHLRSQLPGISLTLSTAFGLRYWRFQFREDIDQAIELGRKAVGLMELGVPQAPTLSNLCTWLRLRYEKWKDENDIFESLKHGNEANKLVPNDALILTNVGNTHQTMYEMHPSIEKLNETISFGQQALEATPEHHSMRATRLFSLAERLILRSKAQTEVCQPPTSPERNSNDRNLAIGYFLECLTLSSGVPMVRIDAGKAVGMLLSECRRWDEAAEALSKAVRLFPRLSPRSLPRSDQQHLLRNITDVSSLAASALLNSGKLAEDALRVFEDGRGIMAAIVMGFREDMSVLAARDPGIAQEYQKLRDQLSPSPPPNGNSESHNSDVETSRRAKFKRLDGLESTIREMRGFERFALSSSSDLKSLAKDGPIVCFNVTQYGSHAFLIGEDSIDSIELPTLQFAMLEEYMGQLVGAKKITQGPVRTVWHRNEQMREMLEWLWRHAVSPVLQRLGLICNSPTGSLSRMWWMASGIMGLAPIHAAGIYNGEGKSSENTSRYVISSYVPTLRALHFSRKRQLKRHDKDFLIVTVPSTPGYPELDTEAELNVIKKSIQPTEPCVLDNPGKLRVLKALETCSIAHFSCHGVYDTMDPSKGGLLLPEPRSRTIDTLTVEELATSSHERAQIAYLSACSTAENSSQDLMDEVIHIASAFQLSGFQHVIGTSWAVNDKQASEVAGMFYEALMSKDWGSNRSAVAEALHEALEKVKGSCYGNIIMWAPFIHLGP